MRYIKLHKAITPHKEFEIMQTMQLDNGILNNYASEPDMYLAMFPAPEQQQRYMLQGAFAILFIASLLGIAFGVS